MIITTGINIEMIEKTEMIGKDMIKIDTIRLMTENFIILVKEMKGLPMDQMIIQALIIKTLIEVIIRMKIFNQMMLEDSLAKRNPAELTKNMVKSKNQ